MFHLWNALGNDKFIKYLKVSLYAINSFIGGKPLKGTGDQDVLVRLSHGLPAFLPSHFRRLIREDNVDFIHIIVSLLYSYKALHLAYGLPDLSSIQAEPVIGLVEKDSYQEFSSFAQSWSSNFIRRLPPIKTFSCSEMFLLSASPNGVLKGPSSKFKDLEYYALKTRYTKIRESLLMFAQAIGHNLFILKFANPWDGIKFPSHLLSTQIRNITEDEKLVNSAQIGKLCCKYEAAGKIRIFAIGDSWSQWALKPLHDYIFALLKLLPYDSTMDQEGTLESFITSNKGSKFWSFDLKSATDMISRDLYVPVLAGLIGEKAAKAWSTIMNRPFLPPFELHKKGVPYEDQLVYYSRGQPMGLLSSWAALALLHHCIVHYAYFKIKPGERIPDSFYRVLGDDIVISNEELALSYQAVCEDFGIVLSLAKSYRGLTIANFASQVISNKGVNYSPISLKEILQAKTLDRKAEFAYRLQRLKFIPEGVNHLFRMFFVSRTWKQESRMLVTGSFSSFGRKALRVLLQPNGYNGLTLVNYVAGLDPASSLTRIPGMGITIGLDTLSGFHNLNNLSSIELNSKLAVYKLDKYLTARLIKWRAEARALVRDLAMSGIYDAMSDFSSIDTGVPRIIKARDVTLGSYNSIFANGNSYKEHAAVVNSQIERMLPELAKLGYLDGEFDVGRYITELFRYVANLPLLFNPLKGRIVKKMLAEVKRREQLSVRGQYTLLERVLARHLLKDFLPTIPGLTTPLSAVVRTHKSRSKRALSSSKGKIYEKGNVGERCPSKESGRSASS